MNLPNLPFRLSLKKVSFALFLVMVIVLLIGRQCHGYFSTRCIDYGQKEYSRRLSDKLVVYIASARLRGIKPCSDDNELQKRISEGRLVNVKSNSKYVIAKMTYSYPCITKDTKVLLDEIANRFSDKTSAGGLKKARFVITSMTREMESLKMLRENNSNASANSPHLYGNAFDISYKRFKVRKWRMTSCDEKFMKEALAQVIWQLKRERRCWATYEKEQSCFHVVCR